MSAKWDEMFGVKKMEVVDEVKVKKPRKKAATKAKPAANKSAPKKVLKETKKAPAKKKPAVKKTTVKKSPPKTGEQKVVKKPAARKKPTGRKVAK